MQHKKDVTVHQAKQYDNCVVKPSLTPHHTQKEQILSAAKLEKSYFESRINDIGIAAKDAARHGLTEDAHGNILQMARHYNGNPVLFVPAHGEKQNKYKKLCNRAKSKTAYNWLVRESDYTEQYAIVRHCPTYLSQFPHLDRYKFPSKAHTGLSPMPMPNCAAIDAYNAGSTGGTVYFTEGYFKAVALAANGIECTAFGGISTFRICTLVAAYLLLRQPDRIVLLYDGDGRDLKPAKNGAFSDRRHRDFMMSAQRFAEQFHRVNTWGGELFWMGVKESLEHKGVDDLISSVQDVSEDAHKDVLNALRAVIPSDYFDVLKLTKTGGKKALKSWFGLSSHAAFYEQNETKIGADSFKFDGVVWRKNGLRFVPENPTHISIPNGQTVNINKYLSESLGILDAAIQGHHTTMIAAPTGSGKSSFWLGYAAVLGYFARYGVKGVFVVPYNITARQFASQNVGVLVGGMTEVQRENAMQKDVIICTFDQLPRVRDLADRFLVVDECHDLVNQANFRNGHNNPVLRNVLESIPLSKKSILLSGTPPLLLCKVMGWHYVDVTRAENPHVIVSPIEAERGKILETVLAELTGENWTDGNIRFLLYDSVDGAKYIHDYLVSARHLQPNEIAIVNRAAIDAGECPTYEHLIKHHKAPTGIKLVLCTCLLSEAININNGNVGGIYGVQVDDIDMMRQWSARFRSMDTVKIKSIRQAKTTTGKRFATGIMDTYNYLYETATNQAAQLATDYKHWRKYVLMNGCHVDDIGHIFDDAVDGATMLQDMAYITRDGIPHVDILAVCYATKRHYMAAQNNDFYYHSLELAGMEIGGNHISDVCHEIAAMAEDAKAENKARLEQADKAIIGCLEDAPRAVTTALDAHYKGGTARNHNALFDAYHAENKADSVAAISWRQSSNGRLLRLTQCRKRILQYMRLRQVAEHEQAIKLLRDNDIQAVGQIWKRWQHVAGCKVVKNRRYQVSPQLATEINVYHKVINAVRAAHATEIAQLDAIPWADMMDICNRHTKTHKGGNFAVWTRAKVCKVLALEWHVKRKAGGIVLSDDSIKCTSSARTFCSIIGDFYPAKCLQIMQL